MMKVCEAAKATHGLGVAFATVAGGTGVATVVAGEAVVAGGTVPGWLADAEVADAGLAALVAGDAAHEVTSATIAGMPRAVIHRAVVIKRAPRESKVTCIASGQTCLPVAEFRPVTSLAPERRPAR
jgi:hypothetical protein